MRTGLLIVLMASLATVAAAQTEPTPPAWPVSRSVVIDEFRFRGPNGPRDEFIELRNVSSEPVDISDWWLEQDPAGRLGPIVRLASVPVHTVIGPGCSYLLASDQYSASAQPDAVYTADLTGEGLGLRNRQNAVVDAVEFNTHNWSSFRETLPARLPENWNNVDAETAWSFYRTGDDTNDNSLDFRLRYRGDPNNSAAPCTRPFPPSPPWVMSASRATTATRIPIQAGPQQNWWIVRVFPGPSMTLQLDARPAGGGFLSFVDAGFVCDDDTTDGDYFNCFEVPLNLRPGPVDLSLIVRDPISGRSSTHPFPAIVLPPPDGDGDGLPDLWETRYNFDPQSNVGANGANGDADGDGRTNLQEFHDGTHPRGTFTRLFAEGAANGFFSTSLSLFNPDATAADVLVGFLGPNGIRTSKRVQLPPKATFTLFPGDLGTSIPDPVFSIVVESDRPVVADRLMSWGNANPVPFGRGIQPYGSHLETAIEAPSTTWYLAEGATGGPYSLYYLLQNPGPTDTSLTVQYLRPAPLPPITRTYNVPAFSRQTLDVAGEDPGLAHTEVSAKLTSLDPIVVERAMYYSTPSQFLAAGHDGAGVTASATRWFLAEGATGFFDEFVLIANAEPNPAAVTVTYLLPDGDPISESITVAGQSRYTITVSDRHPRLAATPVSVIVESTNTVPIVVERVMWWPHNQWYEASLSAGATAPGTKWAIAGLWPDNVALDANYVLIANTGDTDGTATVTLYRRNGEPHAVTVPIGAHRRTSIDVSTVLSLTAGAYDSSVIVESNGVPIVVEHATYSSADGVFWSAGGTSLATRLPAVP